MSNHRNIKKNYVQKIIAHINTKLHHHNFQKKAQGFNVQRELKIKKHPNPNHKQTIKKSTLTNFNKVIYRPELEELIAWGQANELVKSQRNKVIQLIILALMRRRYGKFYQCLDLILTIAVDLKQRVQQIRIKAILLNLICKVYKQIVKRHKSYKVPKRKNRARHTSLMIKDLTSRQLFIKRFSNRISKSNLVVQTTYQKCNLNFKINKYSTLNLPSPSQLFQNQFFQDYQLIVVLVDIDSKTFPYQYPHALKQYISKLLFLQMLSKLNAILVSQTRSFDYQSSIRVFYDYLILFWIVIWVSFMTLAIIYKSIFVVITSALVGCYLGLKIYKTDSEYKNYGETYESILKLVTKWQKNYQQKNIKFRISDQIQALYISIPLTNQYLQSRGSITNSSMRETQKNSLKLSSIRKLQSDGKLSQKIMNQNSNKLVEIMEIKEDEVSQQGRV